MVLAACYSEAVFERAALADEEQDVAIVSVDSESPIEVTATAEFQSLFYDSCSKARPPVRRSTRRGSSSPAAT